MIKKSFIMEAEPKHLFRSISGFKYQLHQALGDLADNSVDANCSKIWITINSSAITIVDDGDGISEENLKKAITPWATNDGKNRTGKRGIYGIGLKSAAFSLGNKLSINTKSKNGKFYTIDLTHSELVEKSDRAFDYSESDKEIEIFKPYRLSKGTIIKISDVYTRKISQPAVDKLKKEIGLMFFRLIDKKQISILINNEKVESINPLLLDLLDGANKNFNVQRNFSGFTTTGGEPGNYAHDYKKQQIKFKRNDGKEVDITIHAVHIGRGSHWSNSQRNKYRYFLKKNITPENELDNGLLKLDEQGIYLMRNDRLITLGGWLGIHRLNTLLHHDVSCRVLIEYNSIDDEYIGVDHTKTKPDLLHTLKDAIRDQYLSKVLQDSESRFRQEGEELTKKRQKKAASEELKNRPRTNTTWGKKYSEADNIRGPSKKEEEDDLVLAREASEKYDWLETVDALPGKCLWAAKKNKEGKSKVYLAERHPGYSGLYLEVSRDKLRKNLNLFFYYLAQFEVDVDQLMHELKPKDKELLQTTFKELRKFVSRQMAEAESEDS